MPIVNSTEFTQCLFKETQMTSAVLVQGIILLLGILPYNPTHHCF